MLLLLDAFRSEPSQYLFRRRLMLAYVFVLIAIAVRVLAGTGTFAT
jgi:hypothetical protein